MTLKLFHVKLYSSSEPNHQVDFKTAVLQASPPAGGLYIPQQLPPLPASFFQELPHLSLQEIAIRVCTHLLGSDIPPDDLQHIVQSAISFPAPLRRVNDRIYALELFHGPTFAFKDFGARFMASCMSYLQDSTAQQLHILVATSGDTGGAVASAYFKQPGIKVTILFPKGKVSPLQEKQLTTWGNNIQAIEIDGTFDDCQSLVKTAFTDPQLQHIIQLTSANSINISRLLAQSFYYFEASKTFINQGEPLIIAVPSGNFGNLTAGLYAKAMGLPVAKFIAATNINDVVPEYLTTGHFCPRPSQPTLSNAMDVGNPSNFLRLQHLYGFTWNNFVKDILPHSITDDQTLLTISSVYQQHDYLLDPHGAVAYSGLASTLPEYPNHTGIFLATAHPAKFLEAIDPVLPKVVQVPSALSLLSQRPTNKISLPVSYPTLRDYLLSVSL